MKQEISLLSQYKWKNFARSAALLLCALSLAGSSRPTFAQQPGQRTFASADEAASTFFAAMQGQNVKELSSILGPAGEEILSSGDPEEDADARVSFAVKYEEMHRFVTEPDGTVTLSDSIGEQQRFVVFRHGRRQRRDPLPARRQK